MWHVPPKAQGEPGLYVKEYRYAGVEHAMRMLLGMESAQREWHAAQRLKRRGLPTFDLMAKGRQARLWGPARSFLVSREIHGAYPLLEWLGNSGGRGYPLHSQLIGELGSLLAMLHEHRIKHLDLHAGNLLIRPSEDRLTLQVVDFQHVRLGRPLKADERIRDLAQLIQSLNEYMDEGDVRAVLAVYCHRAGFELSLGRLEESRKAVLKDWRQRRTRKCLKQGTSFGRLSNQGRCVHFRRDFPIEVLEQILKEATAVKQLGGSQVLKDSQRTTVTRHLFVFGGKTWRICVKSYLARGWMDRLKYLFGRSRARRAWVAGWGLHVREIPAPTPWVLLERRRLGVLVEEALIMEDLPEAQPMSRYFRETFACTSRAGGTHRIRFLKAVAKFLAHLHESQVYHQDLKASNLLIQDNEDGWSFTLVDHDHIRFDRPLTYREIVMNLAQLNASVAEGLSRMDRWRFLLIYSKGASKQHIRKMARDIAELSREKIAGIKIRRCLHGPKAMSKPHQGLERKP